MSIKGLAKLNRSAVYNGAAAKAVRIICAAGESDASKIEELYKSVQILHEHVISRRFKDFSLHGGMFEIPLKREILAESKINNPHFTVGECGGNIESLMRLSKDLSEYGNIIAANENTLSYVELIVRSKNRHFAYPFLLANFIGLHNAGYRVLVFQIYHLLSITYKGNAVALGIDNKASCELNTKIGAEKIGELKQKTLYYDYAALNIRPDVYIIELCPVIQKLEFLCAQTGWRFIR